MKKVTKDAKKAELKAKQPEKKAAKVEPPKPKVPANLQEAVKVENRFFLYAYLSRGRGGGTQTE